MRKSLVERFEGLDAASLWRIFLPLGWKRANSPRSWQMTAMVVVSSVSSEPEEALVIRVLRSWMSAMRSPEDSTEPPIGHILVTLSRQNVSDLCTGVHSSLPVETSFWYISRELSTCTLLRRASETNCRSSRTSSSDHLRLRRTASC